MFILGDKECLINDEPIIYGIFSSEEKLNKAKEDIINMIIEAVFETDPKESGLDREIDEKWVRRDAEETLFIKEVKELDTIIVELPEGEF